MRLPLLSVLAASTMTTACGEPTPRTAADSQAAHVAEVVAAGGVVDSIHPIEEHLRRFRATIADAPDTLREASASRDALVKRWAQAVADRDTAALNAMDLDRAEFAWLFYPDSHLSKPPYESPPELLWGQILASSNQGAQAALRRFGGAPLRVVSTSCPAESLRIEGQNRLHDLCEVTVRSGGEPPVTARLFGTIVERDGRFKFLSFANSL